MIAPLLLLHVVAAAIQHPAGWHSQADIERVRELVAGGKEPWKSAAEVLMNDTSLTADYEPSAAALVCRTSGDVACCPPSNASCGAVSSLQIERDAIAAYYLMLRWVASGDEKWASAAERIIDAWSGQLAGFAGHDLMLMVGIDFGHLAQAAELLASAKAWPLKARAQKMFLEVVHPGCSLICGRTDGGWPQPSAPTCATCANGNWDAACMSGIASWGAFLDNEAMLEQVSEYFRSGEGNGRLVNYILDDEGECQESGRDQGHTQLGLSCLLQAAYTIFHATGSSEILTMEDSRLRKGLEYTAKYNLGYDVPFTPNCGPPGLPKPKGKGWCFQEISERGDFAPMWELAGAIFGEAAPYTQELLTRPAYRPEGSDGPVIHGGAHSGDGPRFGTLMHYGMAPIGQAMTV